MAAIPIPENATLYFATIRDECWKRQIANADNFDKAILTYSSGALGLSLAVLKDFVPIQTAQFAWALYASWILFTVAIVVTTLSFLLSQNGLRAQIAAAEAYYLRGDNNALNNTNGRATELAAWLQAATFMLGIVLTIGFVSTNLKGVVAMTEDRKVQLKEGAPVPTLIQRGAPVPTIQRLPSDPIAMPITPAPATTSTPSAPAAPAPSNSTGSK